MKRFIQHTVLMIGLAALIAAFAVPAEAGRRHHYRAHDIVPRYHAVYRPYHTYHHRLDVHRVYVRRPVVVVPVPHYRDYYYGPSVYYQPYMW